MSLLRSLPIRAALVGAFSILLAILFGVGLLGLYGVQREGAALIELGRRDVPRMELVAAINVQATRLRANVLNQLLAPDAAARAKSMEAFGGYAEFIGDATPKLIDGTVDADERALAEKFRTDWNTMLSEIGTVFARLDAGDAAAANAHYRETVQPLSGPLTQTLQGMVEFYSRRAATAAADGEALTDTVTMLALWALGGGLALGVGLSLAIVLGIGRGIASIVEPMGALANGDLEAEVPHFGARTELGRIAAAVAVFKANALKQRALEQQIEAQKAAAEAEKRRAMADLADAFEGQVMGIVEAVASSAGVLRDNAGDMRKIADRTHAQSTAVAAASEQAASNVSTVAGASEELAASIAEISQQVATSARVSGDAMKQADDTDGIVRRLSASAGRIDEVVSLIDEIAAQTNLLALNATIEAARAGEAGKGFAVVAVEVKTLAEQTGKATGEIATQIRSVQDAAGEAVAAIRAIGVTIRQINEICAAIAGAVEEQGAATREIAENVEQAAAGTGEVSSNIVEVNRAADEIGQVVAGVANAAGTLSDQADVLRSEVGRFIGTVRAA